MAFFYTLMKFIHIAAAIVAVGSNITYGVWNALGAREPAHVSFMLKGLKFLDDPKGYSSPPCYAGEIAPGYFGEPKT